MSHLMTSKNRVRYIIDLKKIFADYKIKTACSTRLLCYRGYRLGKRDCYHQRGQVHHGRAIPTRHTKSEF